MKTADFEQLKKKLAKYCAWQERCSNDVKIKLLNLGASKYDTEKIVKWLTEEKYINDSRFAATFARGKFNNNNWGKNKIIAELRSRNLDEQMIRDALNEIGEKEYLKTIKELALRKWKEIKADDLFMKKQKTATYLVNKGYETDLVFSILEKIEKS
jgi:regulatory protein